MLKVKNMLTKDGRVAPNQFIIDTGSAVYFQSFETVIAKKKKGEVLLLSCEYDSSRTTMGYLCQFLGVESIKDVRTDIKLGLAGVTMDKLEIPMSEGCTIDIPIDESDLDLFDNLIQRNEKFTWRFPDNNGEYIEIRFVKEDT